jgi:hypothetical protein
VTITSRWPELVGQLHPEKHDALRTAFNALIEGHRARRASAGAGRAPRSTYLHSGPCRYALVLKITERLSWFT